VEVGQLVFVTVVLAAGWMFRRTIALVLEPGLVQRTVNGVDVTAAYAIGEVAAYWLIERISAFLA